MINSREIKIREAEKELNYKFPKAICDFILNLTSNEVEFGEDIWCFNTVLAENENENFIIDYSRFFEKEWNVKGIVLAKNFGGDELILLNENNENPERIFVTMHETAEIKLFSNDLNELLTNGPLDYYFDNNYIIKLDQNQNPIWNDNSTSIENTFPYDERALKSKLDDLIDDGIFDKQSEIIEGLEKLTLSNEVDIKIWALNKLSELYFTGFGDLKTDFKKALDYNKKAIDLNSYKAYASFAFCLMKGYGVEKDLNKSLAFAKKANELSKENRFTKIVVENNNDGLYQTLIKLIESEMR